MNHALGVYLLATCIHSVMVGKIEFTAFLVYLLCRKEGLDALLEGVFDE